MAYISRQPPRHPSSSSSTIQINIHERTYTKKPTMSLARSLLHEFRPLFRMLEEPLGRSPAYFGGHLGRFAFDDPFFQAPGRLRPAVDLTEDGENYIVEAELPGVRKEDVQVSIGEGGRSLIIEGSVSKRGGQAQAAPQENVTVASAPEAAAEGKPPTVSTIISSTTLTHVSAGTTTTVAPAQQAPNQLSTERVFTSNATFTRTVFLPRQVDGSRVTAKLNDGVLTLTLPKAEDKASVKIDVE